MTLPHDFVAHLDAAHREDLHGDILRRFEFKAPPANRPTVAANHSRLNSRLTQMAGELCALVPPGRERSLMLTKLEEVRSWGNAGIARNHELFPLED